ncbi:protein phosphatase 1 regulatory subunit 12C isoform X2 [Hyla sarda]|uniref:protein phosphatase 1 regulatory subunit 12C isoform X2 n=1 Tax=Hyla sarda TaxID=327740 RepID=UPI0024C3B8DB|nr:protein phosphatase 1 regulatory subunit 12C isoform X2 [Hyla sarda]
MVTSSRRAAAWRQESEALRAEEKKGGSGGGIRDSHKQNMAEGAAAAAQAKERRKEQLRQWARSCTNQEAAEPRWQRRRRRAGDGKEEDEGEPGSRGEGDGRTVRFERAAEFLAACAGGDLLEAEEMLRGEDGKEIIDSTNTDGISALHQACIDENLEVVEFLVNHNANVNQADNEGWTPLHVAASCGYMEIAEYLLKHSANIAAVNSDGDVPLDIAEDDCMETLLRAEIAKRAVDIEAAKREEEEVMLQDARQWMNAGKIEDIRHPKTGASALHVAAAKGYVEVMRLLLQANFDPNVRDKDGWTPLHAAAHWGVEDACRLLVENFCDMNALNNVGQRPCDVADEEIVSLLEELQKKQEDLRSEKEANLKRAVIDTGMDQQTINTSKHRRSSVCRMSSREKISVQDQSKERKTLGMITVGDDESSSSSEEDNDSGNDPKTNVQLNENGLLPEPQNSTLSPSSPDQKFSGAASSITEKCQLSFSNLRAGLRKTGSFGALQDARIEDNSFKEPGIKRSASSPRLDTQERKPDIWEILQKWKRNLEAVAVSGTTYSKPLCSQLENSVQASVNKEPRMARIPPTPSRRIFGQPESDNLPDTKKEDLEGGLQMKLDMVPTTQMHINTLSSMTATSSTSSSSTSSSTDPKDKRRSYQTPVRDEESESQRKARSRLMRQSRRSTQGVTLTDLKEAEKTLGKSVEIQSTEQRDDRAPVDKEQTAENLDQARRSRLALDTETVTDAPVHTVNSPTKRELESVSKDDRQTENLNHLTTRDRRRWRKELQSANMGVTENEDTETVNHNDTSGHRITESVNSILPYRAGTYSFSRHKESDKDYKKLYEDLISENDSLREQLQEAELKLTQLKLELERVTQRQERHAERPALLELERFERRSLERKAAELEEELKVLSDLKADNQRLKDENAALIRVISKLSK